MTRNLKAFGLALVAAMALGAIGAQGASAVVEHSFNSSVDSTILTGSAESNQVLTFTAGLEDECTGATFSGTVSAKIVDTVTLHPKYSSCTGSTGNTTTHTSGCNYIFDSDTTEDAAHSAGSEHATVSLECESAHSASPHFIETTMPGCNIAIEVTHAGSVTVNQSLHGVRYSQVTHSSKHSLTVKLTVNTLKYTTTAGSLCALAGHPAGTYSNGKITGTFTVTGYEHSASTPVSGTTTSGTSWSHGAQVGLTLSTPT